MAITNVKKFGAPYYDDFDETKNYHRILFRPGFAVQARELTQLQTALQAQIDKLGQYTFADGDRVLGGKQTLLVSNYQYIKLNPTHSSTAISTYLSTFVGKEITNTAGLKAKVLKVVAAETVDGTAEPDTLYLEYVNSGTNTTTSIFSEGDVISTTTGSVVSATVSSSTGVGSVANPIGFGSAYAIEEGVFFVNGSFVHIPAETILLDKYSNTPTYIIGLEVTGGEKSNLDTGFEDLVDNATGSPNESAPGANRYVINLNLIKENINLDNRAVNDYIHLANIKSGIITKKDDAPIDTGLSDRFERRTSEESGDYILAPFILDIKEHLNDGVGNNGYLTSGQGGNDAKLAIGIEPSIAYIEGRRIEKTQTNHVILDKGRSSSDERVINGITQSVGFGNYIKLDPNECEGTPDINDFTTVNLLNSGGSTIGTARARGFEHDSASPQHFRLYIFDVTMSSGQSFSSVEKVSQGSNFEANLGARNGSTLVTTGILGTRFETGDNSLIYPLPTSAVKTLKTGGNFTAAYNVRVKVSGTISGTSVSISMPSGVSLANDDDVIYHIGALSDNNDAVSAPDSIVGGVGGGAITLSSLGSNDGESITVICTGAITAGSVKTKTVKDNGSTTLTYNSSQSIYELNEVDIRELTTITDSAGNDVTDKFILDNGQRDSYYDRGKVILKGGQTLPAGNFTVTFKCFTHNESGNYFSVDSYGSIPYADIGSYNGQSLRDVIDFRPTKGRSGTSTGQEFSTGAGHSGLNMLPPVGTISYNLTHFVGRIDKLFLAKDGTYKVVKGESGLYPVEPQNLENAIHLYNIRLNPYVFSVEDVKVQRIDNKRYTMRDIGAIDSRVKRLEYYTSLSLLEKSASEAQLFDGSGQARFKNGFIVDGFFGHGIGDASHPDYDVSVDRDVGILRPKFDERSINLIRKTGDTGTAVKSAKGGIITMPYTNVVELNQPYSSYAEFVNPYDVVIWDGIVRLSPESDEWKDVDQRPDIIIDDTSAFDQFVTMAESEGILGTVWNEWETNWTGRTVGGVVSRRNQNVSGREGQRLTGVANTRGKARAEVQTTTRAVTQTGTATRTGQDAYVAFDRETKEVANTVVEVNFIPFMRSRKIFFDAELLKPSTKLYAFFNGVDVTAYCRQESSFEEFSDRADVITYQGKTSHPGSSSGALVSDAAGRCIGSFIIPRNDVLKFKSGTREFKLTDSDNNTDSNSTTKALVNFYSQGVLETYQKTIVSTKVPRIAYREVSETNAVTQRTSETTHELVRYYDPLAETFVVDTQGGIFTTSVDLFFAIKDANIPIHVSIREVENGIPTQREVPGASTVVYPTSISLPTDMTANNSVGNADVATTISWDHPVYLKEGTEYAIVLVSNSSEYKVYVSETSKFDLTDGNYRITKQPFNGVFFTSANASTWTPEQTKDLKFKLNRASFTGTSASVSLINDAVPPKELVADPFIFLSKDASANTTTIRVLHPNHGMYGSDTQHKVTLSIPTTTTTINGLARTVFEGSHVVTKAEHDSYVLVLGNEETATVADGRRGGGVEVTATENQMYDLTRLNAQTLEFPGNPDDTSDDVTIAFSHIGMTTKSLDGNSDSSQTLYTFTPEVPIIANQNTQLEVPNSVVSGINKTHNSITEQGTYRINAVLSNNGIENLSPVIDLNRTSAICVQNRINDATANAAGYTTKGTYVAETNPTGTSNVAKYITKKVELNTDGSNIDVFIDTNRPTGSSIDVYYKATDDTDIDFDDIGWTLINPLLPLPINQNEFNYHEAHYQVEAGFPFNAFSIKIVLRSANSCYVPTVKNLRAIANT